MLLHSRGEPWREGGVAEEQENGREEEADEVPGGIKGRFGRALVMLTEFVGRHPIAAVAVAGAVAFPVAVPLVVHGLGFTPGGVTAGSWAAALMRSYHGVVPANSVCAVLQNIGVVGLGAKGIAAASVVGAAATAGVGKLGQMLFERRGAAGKHTKSLAVNKEYNKVREKEPLLEEGKHAEKHYDRRESKTRQGRFCGLYKTQILYFEEGEEGTHQDN